MPGGDLGAGGPGGGSYLTDDLAYGVDANGGIVAPDTTGTDYTVERTATTDGSFIGSFGGGGKNSSDDDYAIIPGILASEGEVTVLPHLNVSGDSGNASVTATEADDVSITSDWAGFNPIVVNDSAYTVRDADISQYTAGDGSETSDFSGLGAGIAAYGSDTDLLVEGSTVGVSGAGNLALLADDGAFVTVKNSTLASYGGTLYADYVNSSNQSTMSAPPWILGIMGSSRLTNLEGVNTTLNLLDSEAISSQWAILSTDASDGGMYLNVANSTLEHVGQGTTDGTTFGPYPLQADNDSGQLTGGALAGDTTLSSNPYTYRSGYGTYTIGDTTSENFYGTTMSVGTFANIFTGGSATYTSLTSGETIELGTNSASFGESYTYDCDEDEDYDADADAADERYAVDADGNVVKRTVIDSDTVGFMCHQGSNTLDLLNGTIVEAPYYIFEHRTGGNLTVDIADGTELRSGSNILVQVENNDDSTTGGAGAGMGGGFPTSHSENAGWPSAYRGTGNDKSVYNVSGSDLVGNVFNASGWAGNDGDNESAVAVSVDLSDGSTLTGQISSTKAVHVTKEGMDFVSDCLEGKAYVEGTTHSNTILTYQNTEFGIDEYYDIGMVANAVAFGSGNTIDVAVDDTSTWNVTASGIVDDVTLATEGGIALDADADEDTAVYYTGTLTVDGTTHTDDTTVNGVRFVHGTPPAASEDGVDSWTATAAAADVDVIDPAIGSGDGADDAVGGSVNIAAPIACLAVILVGLVAASIACARRRRKETRDRG